VPFDPVLKWKKSTALDVAQYNVAWMRNGAPAGSGVVNRNVSLDTLGYSVKFSAHNPGVVVGDGDVIGASLTAVDAGGLASTPVVPADLPIPAEPPTPPVDVTLTLA
jgi:hypothetical protein